MRQCRSQAQRGYMHAASCLKKKNSHSTSFHLRTNEKVPFPLQSSVSVTQNSVPRCQLFQLPQLEDSGGFQTVIRDQSRVKKSDNGDEERSHTRAHREATCKDKSHLPLTVLSPVRKL